MGDGVASAVEGEAVERVGGEDEDTGLGHARSLTEVTGQPVRMRSPGKWERGRLFRAGKQNRRGWQG